MPSTSRSGNGSAVGQHTTAVLAAGFGVSLRTVRKWKEADGKDIWKYFSQRQKRLTGDEIAAWLGLVGAQSFTRL